MAGYGVRPCCHDEVKRSPQRRRSLQQRTWLSRRGCDGTSQLDYYHQFTPHTQVRTSIGSFTQAEEFMFFKPRFDRRVLVLKLRLNAESRQALANPRHQKGVLAVQRLPFRPKHPNAAPYGPAERSTQSSSRGSAVLKARSPEDYRIPARRAPNAGPLFQCLPPWF